MRRPDWLQTRKRLLIVLAGVGAFIASQPVLWPGGFGLRGESPTTTTVEKGGKDEQGNNVKTVETTTPQDGKTLWDWLSLLGVPLSLALLGVWFQQQEKQRDRETAELQRERDAKIAQERRERDAKIAEVQRKVAEDAAKEEVLQVYFDRISTLLVEKNLRAIAAKVYGEDIEDSETQPKETATTEQRELLDASMDVIRARTLSIVRRFVNDGEFKGIVIQFLIEAEIIDKLRLSLRESNLSGANLSGTNLNNADLNRANLSNAALFRANLSNVSLGRANLSRATLRGANLSGANLSGAVLRGAKLNLANLYDTNLHGAYLNSANLSFASLSSANLEAIKFDEQTVWPDPTEVAKAINIPEELKKHLGISTNEPS